MNLPRPDDRGHYTLPDRSRVYLSGVTRHPRWFLWVFEATRKGGTRKSPDCDVGHIAMDRRGVRYFDSPQEALDYLAAVRAEATT